MGTRFSLFTILACLLFCASCTTTNKIAYFQNAQDTAYKKLLVNVEAPLQNNDIVTITISSLDSKASADFNKADNTKGYLIGVDGKIQLPILGTFTAAGITKTQLTNNITNAILSKKLLLDPIVEIRHLNFEITVLGEVARPSVINVPSEQISLVKALAIAGDLTVYGRRDNVLLIREENGTRKTRHINLNSSDFLNSDYYYLKPNDLVYVEPNKTKVAVSGRAQQAIPLIFSSISILFLVFDQIIK